MKAKKRQDAVFVVEGYSSVFRGKVRWTVRVTQAGIEAVRDFDRRRVAIDWRRLIGAAMFYGLDGVDGKVETCTPS